MIIAITMMKARGDMIGIKLSRIEKVEGGVLPPWYYGLSYWKPIEGVTVWHPIPINYIVRWAYDTRNRWNIFRFGLTRMDIMDYRMMRIEHDIHEIVEVMNGAMNGEMNDQNGSTSRTTKEVSD